MDAPDVPTLYGAVGVGLSAWGVASLAADGLAPAPWALIVGCLALVSAGLYMYATRRGKFVVWEKLLDELALRGDERILDLGCGRGAVLLTAARRIPEGRAYGSGAARTRVATTRPPPSATHRQKASPTASSSTRPT
ncbi:hypothetical protein [Streptomyces sp. NPDC093097]|uniref:hypothetical protein n=1 Tax=Streptomyces sp. NPDC093097 TaxID=3366027 RepID=UPI003827D5AA